MARAFKAKDAKVLNNRYDRWWVEFSIKRRNGTVDHIVYDPNDSMYTCGSINAIIQNAMDSARDLTDANHGRVDISFNVYGAKYVPMDKYAPGSQWYRDNGGYVPSGGYHYIKDELVYTFE